ncbi:MAG: GNAT family N-acetyltransferase [Pseudomonadota bacterium]
MTDTQMKIDLSGSPLRLASLNDWREVSDITGEGFANDPVNRWVFGNPRAILSVMRIMAREVYLPSGFSHIHSAGGATMWLPPHIEARLGTLTMLTFAAGMIRFGTKGAMARAQELGKRMAEHHPKSPHAYLFTIAARQSARGKGVGKALLAPVFAHCDREGIPVYLENSNPDNTGFYGSLGFERMGLFEAGTDGPVMEPMWREPKWDD